MRESYHHIESRLFKFKELKVYSSTEWLAENKKKYRQVFNRFDTTYVYAEFSFFNKRFDEEDWDIELDLKCYSLKKGKKELCFLPIKKRVSKFEPIVYIREGWGNKQEGAFWKKGTYYWEVSVQGEKIASKYFYIEEGERTPDGLEKPYMELETVQLYEGPYEDVVEDDRLYLKQFSAAESRYIYLDMIFANLLEEQSWHCELFIKFYNNARELKGQVVRLQKIERYEDEIRFTAGWGSNVKGSWRKDRYTAEIVFMDKLLAVVPFEVGEDIVEGEAAVLFGDEPILPTDHEETTSLSFEELFAKMDGLIGLDAVKTQVKNHARYLQFLRLRKDKGFREEEEVHVHSVFIGNPGTGKTTVAKMMGQLYKTMGVLSKGHVHEVDRVDLVGEYIGQTAPKVKEAIELARGGVLFIDEAYALARQNDDSKDFGREVIEILVKELSNGKGDLAVIVAGYPGEMKHFLNSNPGLKSRFKLHFEFRDYLPQELSRIALRACEEKEVQLSAAAASRLDQLILEAYRKRDKTFGNARFVYDLIDKCKLNLGLRIMQMEQPELLDPDKMQVIEWEDVQALPGSATKVLPHIPIDEQLLQSALQELQDLVGMEKVKRQIQDMVHLVRFYKESGKDVLHRFYLHTVLVGNPGTGKTTVARILTNIYRALGILERGHMVETDRHGLVAGYVGQTAIKTTEKIDQAMGGVLFVDEAYALSNVAGQADYGQEAIQTLLKRMEDDRGAFFVFVAGYPDNMEAFLKANPGLSSRFDKILKFEDYEPKDLFRIAVQMLETEGLRLDKDASAALAEHLEQLYRARDRYFGNARAIRAMVQTLVKAHNLKLADLDPASREAAMAENMLFKSDLACLETQSAEEVFTRSRIGFRSGK